MIKTAWLTIIVLLITGITLRAQSLVPAWGGGADQHDLSFGFSFQYISGYYKVTKLPDWQQPFYDVNTARYITNPLKSINSNYTPGFGIGFIARYDIWDHAEVRTTPTLVFSDPSVTYNYSGVSDPATATVTKAVQRTMVDFPLLLKLKSDRLGNFRAYVLGGVKYSEAIGSKKNSINDDPIAKVLRNKSGYGSYEFGLGCDLYFEYFKLSPEIKLSNSMGNILYREDTPYAAPIDKLSLHTITFSLLFE